LTHRKKQWGVFFFGFSAERENDCAVLRIGERESFESGKERVKL